MKHSVEKLKATAETEEKLFKGPIVDYVPGGGGWLGGTIFEKG